MALLFSLYFDQWAYMKVKQMEIMAQKQMQSGAGVSAVLQS